MTNTTNSYSLTAPNKRDYAASSPASRRVRCGAVFFDDVTYAAGHFNHLARGKSHTDVPEVREWFERHWKLHIEQQGKG